VAASSRVDITISKETIEQISGLSLALAAGFDEKRIDKALSAAALYAAKGQVKPVKNAAPSKTGRLRRAIWANPVMKSKPGAYVGIRAGKSRADTKGAYYRYVVTSGVKRVPYAITPNRRSGAQALRIPGIGLRLSANRVSPIQGRPFVEETVSRNFDTVLRMFGDALASIIERGIPKRGGVRVRLPKPR
jgi:hypothetical protein